MQKRKRRENIGVIGVNKCIMAEEITFCHNKVVQLSAEEHNKSDNEFDRNE